MAVGAYHALRLLRLAVLIIIAANRKRFISAGFDCLQLDRRLGELMKALK
jgi:hypothetical protein